MEFNTEAELEVFLKRLNPNGLSSTEIFDLCDADYGTHAALQRAGKFLTDHYLKEMPRRASATITARVAGLVEAAGYNPALRYLIRHRNEMTQAVHEHQRRPGLRKPPDLDAGLTSVENAISSLRSVGAPAATSGRERVVEGSFDVFISHASEDKDGFVRPLAKALRDRGVRVWYDEFTLKWGDRLRRSIDRGLASSRFGIVVLSESFFGKEWPQRELDGLFALEMDGATRILPIWHEISGTRVKDESPMLADLKSLTSTDGVNAIVDEVLERLGGPGLE